MKQINWFDRKFQFSDEQNIFPSVMERLKGTPLRLRDKINRISAQNLIINIESKWSMLENIGHLIDLEPIWQGRLEDILNNKAELRSVDLSNRKTDLANHNSNKVNVLLDTFSNKRKITIIKLDSLTENEIFKYALHPRLKTPMRIMDLFLFVAEHDDHHLARITEIERSISK